MTIKQNHKWYNAKFFKKWAPVYDYIAVFIAKLRTETAKKADPENKKILDIACGTGAQSIAFAKRGFSVIGIDLSEDMLKRAQKKIKPEYDIKFFQGDAIKTAYANDTFDASSISLGLHGMPEEVAIKILKEMIRVTKRNGQIIIADYNTPQNWLGYQFMKLWESRYYKHFIKVGIDYFLKKVGLSRVSRDVILFNNYQIIVCKNNKHEEEGS